MHLSYYIHRLIFGDDHKMGVCARAWWMRDSSLFWKMFVFVLGKEHCKKNWDYYYGD